MKKIITFIIIFFCLGFLSISHTKAVSCPAIAAPTSLQPSATTTPGPQNLTWNPVPGATVYLVRIHNNSAGTWVCQTSGTEVCANSATNSYPYNFLQSNTYTIWVHAQDACGQVSSPAAVNISVPIVNIPPPEYVPRNPTYLFVAPSGNDSNPGTLTSPIRTVSLARDVVRNMNANMAGDIVVYLRSGYYQLTSPLAFDTRDSGTNGYFVIYESYPGEVSMISGGKTITAWQVEGNKWKAFVGTGIDSRQFYMNGVRATRAAGSASTATVSTWQNITNIEAIDRLNGWQEHRCPITSVTGGAITFQEPCKTLAPLQGTGSDYGGMNGITSFENAFELLDTPGEWYLNKTTGWIYYMPRTGENISTSIGVLPTLETLVQANGTSTTSIQNVKFQRLIFAYATWLGPNTGVGFINTQAEYYINANQGWSKTPANVTVNYGQNIDFANNIFIHLGGVGLNIGNGSKNSVIAGNYFTDISSGAVTIGDVDQPKTTDDHLITRGNQFVDNVVHDVAVEFHSAADVLVGYTQNTILKHNEIYNSTWEGLAIGWGWGTADPTVAKDNLVESNLIYNVCTGFGDCGGLYSLSSQPGNIYAENYIHNISKIVSASYGGPACLYLDNASANLTVNSNLLTQCNLTLESKCNGTCLISGNDASAGGLSASIAASAGLDSSYIGIKNLPAFPDPIMSTPSPTLLGDFNADGHVDILDYNLLVSKFGKPYTIFDYNSLVTNFGK